jgi:hypothetical protein
LRMLLALPESFWMAEAVAESVIQRHWRRKYKHRRRDPAARRIPYTTTVTNKTAGSNRITRLLCIFLMPFSYFSYD